MPIHKPPLPAPDFPDTFKVFLAGSIDMGAAIDWQAMIEQELDRPDVAIFNPRRDDWDSSWTQDIANPSFKGQVDWELDHLDRADLILFFFDPAGKAPITLLELGLHAASGKCLVGCPPGFWRRGNVQIVCDRFGIPLLDSLDDLIAAVRQRCAVP